MGISGSLQKLKITAYQDNKFKVPVKAPRNPFYVTINPEKYSEKYEICYTRIQAPGSSGRSPEFNLVKSENLDLELVFDGTGVLPSPIPGVLPFTEDGISEQMDAFRKLVFDFNGKIHSPNYLSLVWGELEFECRLSALDITYTMFKPDGTPLRARANCTFLEYTNPIELEEEANQQSADVTHYMIVKGGDTLPLMCYDIYGSSVYYVQVAKANGLTDFRSLRVGQELQFPPLREAPE